MLPSAWRSNASRTPCIASLLIYINTYLPIAACHPSKVFRAVVLSEATRILRRCMSYKITLSELEFFRRKLLRRGYSNMLIQECFRIAKRKHTCRVPSSSTSASVRKSYIKVTHSGSVNYKSLNKCLGKHAHLVNSNVCVATTVQRNIFRLLYSATWRF